MIIQVDASKYLNNEILTSSSILGLDLPMKLIFHYMIYQLKLNKITIQNILQLLSIINE